MKTLNVSIDITEMTEAQVEAMKGIFDQMSQFTFVKVETKEVDESDYFNIDATGSWQ